MDWIRQTGDGKPAALPALTARKPDFDDQKLLTLLDVLGRGMVGLHLIHFHLSALADRDPSHTTLVRSSLQNAIGSAPFLQILHISNGDVFALYQGVDFPRIAAVCEGIERALLAQATPNGSPPPHRGSLFSILDLSLHAAGLMRFLEDLRRGARPAATERPKPPIPPDEVGKLERAMPRFDPTPFLFHQPVVDIQAELPDSAVEYHELYISIKRLQERLCPKYDLAANRWLFRYFSSSLDRAVLKTLKQGLSALADGPVGLNVNVSTVLSDTFSQFDECLPQAFRGNMVLEIGKGDLVENLDQFAKVVEVARTRQYRICIDGLDPRWAGFFDLEKLDCDYAKIFWCAGMGHPDERTRRELADLIARQNRCRIVLAQCDSLSSLVFAHETGIRLVQGRAVGGIRRRGLSVRDAIQAALQVNGA